MEKVRSEILRNYIKNSETRASSNSDLCGSLVGNAVAECLSFCAGESAFSAECRADGLSALANSDEFGLDFNITSNACFCCAGGQVARDVKLTGMYF